jgi:hypothetical protein
VCDASNIIESLLLEALVECSEDSGRNIVQRNLCEFKKGGIMSLNIISEKIVQFRGKLNTGRPTT